MSSTTRGRARERGQVLVLFAGAAAVLLVVAALAFDVGMMLVERRDQQDAADAAALAGARAVLTSGNYNGTCDAYPTGNTSVDAACEIARTNGYDSTLADENVHVYIPPVHGIYKGFKGFVEVQIDATRPSILGNVIGRAMWPVGAYAVAANQPNLTFPFSMLALDPTACKAIQVSGTGNIIANANIQSNSTGSDCTGEPISFSRTGGSTIDIHADDATCRAAGEIQDQGSGSMTCTPSEYSFVLPDPLRFLPAPPKSLLAAAMQPVGHTKAPPKDCPGYTSNPPSESSPRLCDVGGNGASYAGLKWLLYPGLYPGGISVTNGATAYLMPGVYWIGGGGFTTKNDASVVTVGSAADAATGTAGGGVMIYNSKLPNSAGGDISLGGSGATLKLQAMHLPDTDPYAIYNDIVIFQDRELTNTVTLNGSASIADVDGLVYVPDGLVKLNGNSGTLQVDQIIAGTYLIDGNGGTIYVDKDSGVDAVISGGGLVE